MCSQVKTFQDWFAFNHSQKLKHFWIRSLLLDNEKCAFPLKHEIQEEQKQDVCGGKRLWHITDSHRKQMIFCKWPSLSQISKVCVPEMLSNNTKVESSVWNCAYVCSCCSFEVLQSCCCYSYHPSKEQIACQNKHSHFRQGDSFPNGCSWVAFFSSALECLQIQFMEGRCQGSEKRVIITAEPGMGETIFNKLDYIENIENAYTTKCWYRMIHCSVKCI